VYLPKPSSAHTATELPESKSIFTKTVFQ